MSPVGATLRRFNGNTNMTAPFVAQIDLKLADKLTQDLQGQGFELSTPAHTIFSAKKKGITCTLYQSGKLVVQGKESPAFIEFYLEPHILGTFSYSHPTVNQDLTAHIGIDESGKGDFFGPLCVAGVFAGEEQIAKLLSIGVKDSKNLSDDAIRRIAPKIQTICQHHIVKINPAKYNEIYANFRNLNKLLGWAHATTIEQLVERTGCLNVTIDQFADESVVITALKRKQLKLELTQRHRAEEDVVVAAASILARYAFIEGLKKLSDQAGIVLPKGASAATINAGKRVYEKFGKEGLGQYGKLHFKTIDSIIKQ